jgi:hypothetical protein
MKKAFSIVFLASLGLGLASQSAEAAAVAGQVVPVAVYSNWQSAFGLAYDSKNDLMWYTQGDSGDGVVRSFTPYKNLVAPPFEISQALGSEGANTTSPTGGSYFRSLAFDSATGQLVMQGSGSNLQSFDPITANNNNNDFRPGSANTSFSDGLDVDGTNTWFSPDVGPIYNNGSLVVNTGGVLPSWSGLGSATTFGYSGVEQVGTSLFAVAVQDGGDAGRTRTIVRFDLAGNLLGYDPDGDPVAARWEDLAYDGRYLYAADLRGDHNEDGIPGDVYVFDVTGGLDPGPARTPEPSAVLSLIALGGLGLVSLKRKQS